MSKKKNKKSALLPEPPQEITVKLTSPTGTQDPMKDPEVVKILKELQDLKKFNDSYAQGIKMTEYHLEQCHTKTGMILLEDVQYCLNLAKRMANHSQK